MVILDIVGSSLKGIVISYNFSIIKLFRKYTEYLWIIVESLVVRVGTFYIFIFYSFVWVSTGIVLFPIIYKEGLG